MLKAENLPLAFLYAELEEELSLKPETLSSSCDSLSAHPVSNPFTSSFIPPYEKQGASYVEETTYAHPFYLFGTRDPSYLIKEYLSQESLLCDDPKIFEALQNLKPEGSLKQTAQGDVYLKISDDYIHELLPFFKEEGAQAPLHAAHIPLISKQQWSSTTLDSIHEIGEIFSFEVIDCQKIKPSNWPSMESLWILAVASKELSLLRSRYRLGENPPSGFFTIVIAVAPKKVESEDSCLFRVSPALSFA